MAASKRGIDARFNAGDRRRRRRCHRSRGRRDRIFGSSVAALATAMLKGNAFRLILIINTGSAGYYRLLSSPRRIDNGT